MHHNQKHTMNQNTNFAYLDAMSKAIVWNAYAENFACEEILDEGFNINSGYVYLALECGVTLASCFGQPCEFIIYDNEKDEELFFDSAHEANAYLNQVN